MKIYVQLKAANVGLGSKVEKIHKSSPYASNRASKLEKVLLILWTPNHLAVPAYNPLIIIIGIGCYGIFFSFGFCWSQWLLVIMLQFPFSGNYRKPEKRQ